MTEKMPEFSMFCDFIYDNRRFSIPIYQIQFDKEGNVAFVLLEKSTIEDICEFKDVNEKKFLKFLKEVDFDIDYSESYVRGDAKLISDSFSIYKNNEEISNE
jgi:hypothetical protein|nr:MAG TPA: hypothetical protein [Caudoviricetes sp.]